MAPSLWECCDDLKVKVPISPLPIHYLTIALGRIMQNCVPGTRLHI